MTDFTAIVPITIICYVLAEVYKAFVKDPNQNKHIPVLCYLLGAILGTVAYFLCPDIIHSENIFTAICVGIISGACANSGNQIIKQYFPKKDGEE